MHIYLVFSLWAGYILNRDRYTIFPHFPYSTYFIVPSWFVLPGLNFWQYSEVFAKKMFREMKKNTFVTHLNLKTNFLIKEQFLKSDQFAKILYILGHHINCLSMFLLYFRAMHQTKAKPNCKQIYEQNCL